MDFLRQNDLPFVCVDEPQGFESSIPPITEATSDISLIRFHGRTKEMWEKKRIKERAAKTKQLHVWFDNCYTDKAVVNARQIGCMLD